MTIENLTWIQTIQIIPKYPNVVTISILELYLELDPWKEDKLK